MTAELNIDVELTPDRLNRTTTEGMAELEPFGKGNEIPVYVMSGCKVVSRKLIGRDKNHLKLNIEVGGRDCVALWWDRGEIYNQIKCGQYVSVAFCLEDDSYRGRDGVQMIVKDMYTESEEGSV